MSRKAAATARILEQCKESVTTQLSLQKLGETDDEMLQSTAL